MENEFQDSYSVPNFEASVFIAGNNFASVESDVVDEAAVALELLQLAPVRQPPQDQVFVPTTRN